tara:strand:+ start:727 stop:4530 length:3804 start_codon:yes stop_codon:yes gene_type:complete
MGQKIEYGKAGLITSSHDPTKSLLGHTEGSEGKLLDWRDTTSYPGPYDTGPTNFAYLISTPIKYPLAGPDDDPWVWPFNEWVKMMTPRQIHITDFHLYHGLDYNTGERIMDTHPLVPDNPYIHLKNPCYWVDKEASPNYITARASETKYLWKIIGPGWAAKIPGVKETTEERTLVHPVCKTNTTAGSGSEFGTNPKIIKVFNTIEMRDGMTVTGDGIPASTTIADVLSSSLVLLNNDVTATSSGYIPLTFKYQHSHFVGAEGAEGQKWRDWQTADWESKNVWYGNADSIDTRESMLVFMTDALHTIKTKITLKNPITSSTWDNPYSWGGTGSQWDGFEVISPPNYSEGTDFVSLAIANNYPAGDYEVYNHQVWEGNGDPDLAPGALGISTGISTLTNPFGDRGGWALYNSWQMCKNHIIYEENLPNFPNHDYYSWEQEMNDGVVPEATIAPSGAWSIQNRLPYSPHRAYIYGDLIDTRFVTAKISYDEDPEEVGNNISWVACTANGTIESNLTHPNSVFTGLQQYSPSRAASLVNGNWVGSLAEGGLELGRGYFITASGDVDALTYSDGHTIFPDYMIEQGYGNYPVQVWGDSILLDPDTGIWIGPDFTINTFDYDSGQSGCHALMWFGDICEPHQTHEYPVGQGVKWYNLVIPNNSEGANWYPQPGEGNDSGGSDNPNFGKSYWTVIHPTDYSTFPFGEVGGEGNPWHYAGFMPLSSKKSLITLSNISGYNHKEFAIQDIEEYHYGTLRHTDTSGFYWMDALLNQSIVKPLLGNNNDLQYHQYESFWAKYWYDPIRQEQFASMGGRVGCQQWNCFTVDDYESYLSQNSPNNLWKEEQLHGRASEEKILCSGEDIKWDVRTAQHNDTYNNSYFDPRWNSFSLQNWSRECTGVPRYHDGGTLTSVKGTWNEPGNQGLGSQWFAMETTLSSIPVHSKYNAQDMTRYNGTSPWDNYIAGKSPTTGNVWNKFKHGGAYAKQWPERAPGFDKSNVADGSYHLTDAASNTGDRISCYSMPFTWLFWSGTSKRFFKVRPVIVRWKYYDDSFNALPVPELCFWYYADNHRTYMNDLKGRTMALGTNTGDYAPQEFFSDSGFYDGSDNLSVNNGLSHGVDPTTGLAASGLSTTPYLHGGSFIDYTLPSPILHPIPGGTVSGSMYEENSTSGNGGEFENHYTIKNIESGEQAAQLNFWCGKYNRPGHPKHGTIQPVNDRTRAYMTATAGGTSFEYQYGHRHYMMIQNGTSITFNTSMESSGSDKFERDYNLELENGE